MCRQVSCSHRYGLYSNIVRGAIVEFGNLKSHTGTALRSAFWYTVTFAFGSILTISLVEGSRF